MSNRERTAANLEAKLANAQKTTDEAKAVVEADRNAMRAKAARLKADRLANEAVGRVAMLDNSQKAATGSDGLDGSN